MAHFVVASMDTKPLLQVSLTEGLPPLARVGVRLTVPPSLSHLTYLGRGPHECYPDRKVMELMDSNCVGIVFYLTAFFVH
jgi:hypothetical protein